MARASVSLSRGCRFETHRNFTAQFYAKTMALIVLFTNYSNLVLILKKREKIFSFVKILYGYQRTQILPPSP